MEIKVYIAGSLISEPVLREITSVLRRNKNFKVFFPLEIETLKYEMSHSVIPFEIAEQCKEWIMQSDIVLINLENFGRDTSWEVGFAEGLGKKRIGFIISNLRILEDWMVKRSIEGLICLNTIPDIMKVWEKDPFFNRIMEKISYIGSFDQLPFEVMKIARIVQK